MAKFEGMQCFALKANAKHVDALHHSSMIKEMDFWKSITSFAWRMTVLMPLRMLLRFAPTAIDELITL